jgi:hypothetical protein
MHGTLEIGKQASKPSVLHGHTFGGHRSEDLRSKDVADIRVGEGVRSHDQREVLLRPRSCTVMEAGCCRLSQPPR